MHAYDPLAIGSGLAPFDFHEFAPFNDGAFAVFQGTSAGASPWEMHPDTDELLFVLAGSVTVEILPPEGAATALPLTPGRFVVVPVNHWHRHVDALDLVELYFTPGQSLASEADDPRVAT